MKLYSWISNERKTLKTQGGNREINIGLDYEEQGGDWRNNPESHRLHINVFFPDNNPDTKPNIFIFGNRDFNIVDLRDKE